MADDVIVDVKSCPYKGDGFKGWGELMQGFAQSHGRLETENCQTTGQTTKDIRGLSEDITTEYTKNITHLTGAQRKCLVKSMGQACHDYYNNQWTKDKAMSDVEDITDAIFNKFHQRVVPAILNKQCTHGLYNDTSTQLIMDRAYAETQQEATALTLQNIKDYFGMYSQLAATLTGFIQQAIADTYQEDFDQLQDRDQDEENRQEIDKCVKDKGETNKSLNLKDLAIDMGLLAVAAVLLEQWLLRSYTDCGASA